MASRNDREFLSFKNIGKTWYRRIMADVTSPQFNKLSTTKTTVPATSELKLITPSNAVNFFVIHKSTNAVIYIGEEDVDETSGFPMSTHETLQIEHMQKNNENEIYIYNSHSEAVDVYCVGTYKES